MGAKIINYLKNFIKISFTELFDLIYKRRCINCGKTISVEFLCKNCSKDVQNLPPFAQSVINGYKLYSAFFYEGAVKKMIQSLKFKHNKEVSYHLALYLKKYLDKISADKKNELNLENAIIIPVLTHKKNYNERGYDNVLLIAKELSNLTGYELNSNVLIKTKYTEPMYKLTAKQRINHIKDSFILKEDFSTERPVILLDDIVTTGSTLNFITSLFKNRGINNLICLTVAKTKLTKKRF